MTERTYESISVDKSSGVVKVRLFAWTYRPALPTFENSVTRLSEKNYRILLKNFFRKNLKITVFLIFFFDQGLAKVCPR